VKSKATPRFWKCYDGLSAAIKKQAKEAYKTFINNPYHPGLHFKRIHSNLPIFSVRITKNYRAIGVLNNDEIVWFWIGSHSEYDKLIKQIKT
jgi:mRNA-degrading endonuclease RelE of RelBE toxin-antitoxin system